MSCWILPYLKLTSSRMSFGHVGATQYKGKNQVSKLKGGLLLGSRKDLGPERWISR